MRAQLRLPAYPTTTTSLRARCVAAAGVAEVVGLVAVLSRAPLPAKVAAVPLVAVPWLWLWSLVGQLIDEGRTDRQAIYYLREPALDGTVPDGVTGGRIVYVGQTESWPERLSEHRDDGHDDPEARWKLRVIPELCGPVRYARPGRKADRLERRRILALTLGHARRLNPELRNDQHRRPPKSNGEKAWLWVWLQLYRLDGIAHPHRVVHRPATSADLWVDWEGEAAGGVRQVGPPGPSAAAPPLDAPRSLPDALRDLAEGRLESRPAPAGGVVHRGDPPADPPVVHGWSIPVVHDPPFRGGSEDRGPVHPWTTGPSSRRHCRRPTGRRSRHVTDPPLSDTPEPPAGTGVSPGGGSAPGPDEQADQSGPGSVDRDLALRMWIDGQEDGTPWTKRGLAKYLGIAYPTLARWIKDAGL